MIEIMNLRDLKGDQRWYWKKERWDMKADRSSPVGNPYEIGRDGNRDQVCDKYEREFERLRNIPFFEAYLQSLVRIYKRHGRLRLWCWCAPKRCHVETIKHWMVKQLLK
jgi:hypothetical protein